MSDFNMAWDIDGEREYETGVDHGVLFTQKAPAKLPGASGAFNKCAYGKATVWNGLSSVTETPGGAEANNIYADNIKYAILRSAETLGGTIEAYMYPPEFGECNGEASPVSGVHVGQQKRKSFGFSFRTDVGDDEDSVVDPNKDYKLHLWYNCTAKPSDRQYQTINESPEAITFSWEIETTPIAFRSETYADLVPTASLTIDSRQFTDANKAKLTALLEVLYGTAASGSTAATEGYLPTPDAVLDILSTGEKPTEAQIDRGNA